jgi:rhamnulokinase
MNRTAFLAFDLGAESGRAFVGRLRGHALEMTEAQRFPNAPVRAGDSLRWDVAGLWHQMQSVLDACAAGDLAGIGVDTWGCDYALLGADGQLLDAPFHYRDRRTDGVLDAVVARVSRDRIYKVTGIQFLPFNTLYQLYAACRSTPDLIARAATIVTIPDLLNYWLTGRLAAEYTNATTTQCVNARTRSWATDLLDELDLPSHLFPPLVEPGTVLGPLRAEATSTHAGTPVFAPACHDTGSAVAAVNASGDTAFLSSGTWSLVGTEVPQPVITRRGRELNFTNEGGVGGTSRLLKNVAGLWLLQACRAFWEQDGQRPMPRRPSAASNRSWIRTIRRFSIPTTCPRPSIGTAAARASPLREPHRPMREPFSKASRSSTASSWMAWRN